MKLDVPDRITEGQIASILKIRRQRAQIFGDGLFSEPAWDILLELFAAELANRKLMLADFSAIAPRSTLARWVAALHERGLIECELDLIQSDQFWIRLSSQCAAGMKCLLSDARHLAPWV